MWTVPPEALRTGCVPGCSSVIEWVYDSGERADRYYLGSPETVEPNTGCVPEHLEDPRLYEIHGSDVWRYVYQWELLTNSTYRRYYESRQFLAPILSWWAKHREKPHA